MGSKKAAMKVRWGLLIFCIGIFLIEENQAFAFRQSEPNRHAFQNHDAVEKWGDWNSPTMLNMLLRATQKAQRLMAYKKKKNNLEERNRPNLLSEGSQDSIYEQHVKRPQVVQARPQRKTVPIFNSFSTLFKRSLALGSY